MPKNTNAPHPETQIRKDQPILEGPAKYAFPNVDFLSITIPCDVSDSPDHQYISREIFKYALADYFHYCM